MLFMPDGLTEWVLTTLLTASFVGSFITASVGAGGGLFLLVVMAEFLAPTVLIPVHGLVQLASNGGRAWLTRGYIDYSLVVAFLAGGALASVVGLLGLVRLPMELLNWMIVIFVLYSCWGKMPALGFSSTPIRRVLGGFFTTIATLFIGASGPLVASWLRTPTMDRFYYTANFSTCMTLQHTLKVLVFSFVGFSFSDWFWLILLLAVSGYVGTQVGLKCLGRLPEVMTQTLFKWILTLLAVRLLYRLVFI